MFRIGFVLLAFAAGVSAQSTIFNVPSTDVQPRGSLSLEADFITKPVSFRDGGYQTYGYRVVYGTGNKTEIGANFFLTHDAGGTGGQVQMDAKRTVYGDEKHGVAVSGGVIATLPVRAGSGAKPDVMFYMVGSKTIPQLGGTRVTAGAYGFLTTVDAFGSKAGAIIGVEQPIVKKLSFLTDWSSGHNKVGYSTAGLDLSITKKQYLIAGWNFGNTGRGNNAFSTFYGYVF